MTTFLDCLPFVLAQECPFPNDWSNPKNFSNDRGDKGGPTQCGIIQREYDHYRKSSGFLVQPVQRCTQSEGYTIYKMWYWDPHCDSLGPGLDLSFFDAAVNQGSMEAIRILQASLGEPVDGIWGPLTAAAAGRTPVAAAVTRFFNRRVQVYKDIAETHSNDARFLTGWERRATSIFQSSLAMAHNG